ncbi:MAG: TonB-dependent receptor [Colwellia sp.]|nr:TonB-dependent receptor [Colwellia sp.]
MFYYPLSLALLIIITLITTANAANHPTNNIPDEIITVTAQRLAISELLSPYSTALIYEDEIMKKGIRTTVDALATVPGVYLQKTAHGQGSPYIRGFTGFRNIFLIDGIRLNNSVFRDGPNQYWNTVDPYSITKFEVVKGTTSVIYGSDAIGGTVNAITKLQTLDDFNTQSLTSLVYRGATAEQSNVIRASFANKISTNSGLSVGFSAKDYGNLIAGGKTNEQPNTNYDEFNVDLKWIMSISDDFQLTTAYFKTKQNDVPRTHKTVHSISFAGTEVGSELTRDLDQERSLLYFKLDANQETYFSDSSQLTLSYQKQHETRNRVRTNNRTDQQGFDVNTLGINLNLFKQEGLHNIVYGLEYYRDHVDSFSSNNDIQGPVADNSSYQWFGIYGQNKYYINDKTSIDFGTRWSYMSVNANKIQNPFTGNQIAMKNHWNNVVFNFRGNFQITPKSSSVYMGISQAFRAPNLSDLTRFDSARSNEFEIPALQLEPENYLTFDSGIKFRSNKLNYDISIYYTKIEDQIQRVPTGNMNSDGEFEITKKNIGNGYTYGSDIDINYSFTPELKVSARMAYIIGRIDTFPNSNSIMVREYMSRLMPTNINVAINYSAPADDWWIHSSVTVYDAGDRLSTRDKSDTQRIPPKGTPGFAIWDIGGRYTVSESMQLTLNLQNILDKNYRIHGSGQNEAGINLIASIEYQF